MKEIQLHEQQDVYKSCRIRLVKYDDTHLKTSHRLFMPYEHRNK